MTINETADIIKNCSNIAVIPHINVDGDCLGSSFALSRVLKKLGKTVQVILEDDVPNMFSFLNGEYFKINDLPINAKFDTVICVDCGDEGRLNNRIDLFNSAKTTINIDHHKTNTYFADFNFVDADSAATGEIIYNIIKLLGVNIDEDIATNLYVAIYTDTGGFKYSNTSGRTHKIIGEIVETGIDIAKTNRNIMGRISLKKLKLISKAIDYLELHEDGKVALISLSQELIKNLDVNYEDIESLSDIPRSIDKVEVGIIFKEKYEQEIKVSFRSNEYADVSKIATYFGGGGHERASGCTLNMSLQEAKDRVLKVVKSEIK